jgi:hypothetical protein
MKILIKREKAVCCLCGMELKDYGHNPWPLKKSGRCCEQCNWDKVIPARLEDIKQHTRMN